MSAGPSEEPAGPGGGYITRGRALSLERQMAALEARLDARLDALEREVHDVRALSVEALRAQASALLGTLRDQIAGTNGAGATSMRGGTR